MKLRILGDTLRVRLAQGEVAQLVETGRVEQRIHFGAGPGEAITYAVCRSADATIRASLNALVIEVHIPAATVQAWVDSDEVSLRAEQRIDDERTLAILVEKDFKCLVPRDGEQDYDGFPNPQTSC